MEPILRMEGISKAFPGVQALDRVDFEAYAGEVMALVGENGAGKSTLVKILSGVYKRDSGRIYLEGKRVEIQDPYHAQLLGISTIHQELNVTPNQTVAQNIFLGREIKRKGIWGFLGFVDKKEIEERAKKLLERVGANIPPDELVKNLSVAQIQLVEIAKALALKAKIIIMDEPTSALGPEEVEKLFEVIKQLKDQGIAIVFISHRLEEVFRIADRITILRDGKLVGYMSKDEATPDKVIYLMVNRPIGDMFKREEGIKGEPILEVRNLSSNVVKNVSFTLYKGEILGIAGLVGSGRTELVRLIFGADPKKSGEIFIEGNKVEINSPEDAVKFGIGLVPEDRQNQGLILNMPIRENIGITIIKKLLKLLNFVDKAKLTKISEEFVRRLNIKTPSVFEKVLYLSGGNQQKVVLSKWLASEPKILILDEPTRGIDVGAKAEIHAIMSQLARSGISIIMISSEMPEVLAMSDRILVMSEGKIVAEVSREEATQEKIMAYASGNIVN
ncbi:ABC transporter related [Dictyoglomus turgidum DSM 6724]|uniref:ABC transporter related n=2 Tax=Dictyoglomaceae TaxID=203488 RepID=B8E365_DICTD|nr:MULTISPECIES: sugar ABC transporter ATP-binding protein [Dictyoglomus]ACK42939.1 ABC transporter related [Dictyoglomus turgidum DSM 6724]PNV80433.1 MAG: sugar ABC transporter ATP-binding protein [Dictyoglomus turgidum]HBU31003.1 sugar ABC transporter ATP-binding protein [Dictyoglomus sp.]